MATDLSVTRSAPHATSPGPRNLGLALAIIAVAQLMVVLDVAIVNVALPSIQRSLHFTATNLEWVVNAYAIAFGGLLLLGGRAGDLYGRRRMFIAGTLLFTIGSLAGGLATTSTLLIIARVAQGIGGAVVAPTALSLLADLGVYSAVSAGGGALGLLLGGVITNYFSWRWILFVNVPVGIVLALVAPRVLLATKRRSGRLDLPGAVAVTVGATLLVYSLSRASTHGWRDSVTVATLAIALGLLVVFIAIEALSREPLMPLRIFVNRNRSGAYVLSLAIGAVLSGMLFLLTLFLQDVLRFTPLEAGFAFLPTAAGIAIGAGITSRLVGRIGSRVPMTLGALLVAVGLFWLSGVTVHAGYASHVLGPLVVLAVGLGGVFVSTSVTAISGVTFDDSGLASALLNVGRQLGGSLGIAVLGTVAATVTSSHLANGPSIAITTGYATAFEVASGIAFAGFLVALATIRGSKAPITRDSKGIAA